MGIEKLEDYRLQIVHDGSLQVATGRSRWEKNWKNRMFTWAQLLAKLKDPVRTPETRVEYLGMPKGEQDRIKDVGGFVGGTLKNGRRGSVEQRQIITLDADFASPGLLDTLYLYIEGAFAVYSTHKHTPEKPRLRILIPLDRPVTPDEYEAIARKLAETIGIDYFDDTTYQPSRLMYWPSVSSDGQYVFDYEDEEWICADEILKQYPDWTDTSYWPESSRTQERRKKTAAKQGDPCEKKGSIGAFCRTYTIEEAITEFLSDIYVPCAMPGRYTYAEGSTSAGLVLYDDKFAYSNHATDPAGGKLCNAFDLVRIHKFGMQDEDAAPDTATTRLPSYKAMMEFVQEDKETRMTLGREMRQEAVADFDDLEDDGWLSLLEYNKKGLENSLKNVLTILQYDPMLKPIVFNQMADNLEIKGAVAWEHPGKFWRDADDAQLEAYLAVTYTEFSKAKILSAITKVADDRAYHPVKEYLESLPKWDGLQRVDRLLVDYLGAPDDTYTHEVTRKTLCAAIVRVFNPGCKFDTVLTMEGPQGTGKSTLVKFLGGDWFSDSISLSDTKDKTAAEKVQGNWIIEFSEMAGLRKADERDLKGFITRQDDKYRASYGRRVESHPRQCIFIGTTNESDGYLNDTSGGRRYWPVSVTGKGKKSIWEATQEERSQIWAEALVYVRKGEKLTLSDNIQATAKEKQKDAMQSDPREGMIREYLEKLLPENWADLDIYDRRDFLYGNELGAKPLKGTVVRKYVCYQEIWCECFRKPLEVMEARDSYAIKRIMAKIEGWTQTGKRIRIVPYGMQRVYEKV